MCDSKTVKKVYDPFDFGGKALDALKGPKRQKFKRPDPPPDPPPPPEQSAQAPRQRSRLEQARRRSARLGTRQLRIPSPSVNVG